MARNTPRWVDSADISRAVERLRRRGEGVLTAAKRGLKEGVDIVVQDAKSRCPVKTGKLRDSIHAEEKENGAVQEIVADAKNENGVPYAKIVEYSPRINQPFLFPAIDANRHRLNQKIARAIRDASH